MKNRIMLLLTLICMQASSQSPSLSIKIKMDNGGIQHTDYLLEMKFCYPKQSSPRGNWFTHDKSVINFEALKTENIINGIFFKNGDGVEVLSGNKTFEKYNSFEYGNQVFAWETIMVIRISDAFAPNMQNAMYLVLPVIYKSFVTQIDLSGIVFKQGTTIFLNKVKAEYNEGLNITCKKMETCGYTITNPSLLNWIRD